jgi:hypothetical protein
MRGGRSRNKVAVGEPAAGSPPIYYLFKIRLTLGKFLINFYLMLILSSKTIDSPIKVKNFNC